MIWKDKPYHIRLYAGYLGISFSRSGFPTSGGRMLDVTHAMRHPGVHHNQQCPFYPSNSCAV